MCRGLHLAVAAWQHFTVQLGTADRFVLDPLNLSDFIRRNLARISVSFSPCGKIQIVPQRWSPLLINHCRPITFIASTESVCGSSDTGTVLQYSPAVLKLSRPGATYAVAYRLADRQVIKQDNSLKFTTIYLKCY
jgi:hypothetical protein